MGREVADASDYSQEGTRYVVTDANNPWELPVGAELEEVRRGEYWDKAMPVPIGDRWVWLRPFVPGGAPQRDFTGHVPAVERARPILLEKVDQAGHGTWVATWLAVIQ